MCDFAKIFILFSSVQPLCVRLGAGYEVGVVEQRFNELQPGLYTPSKQTAASSGAAEFKTVPHKLCTMECHFVKIRTISVFHTVFQYHKSHPPPMFPSGPHIAITRVLSSPPALPIAREEDMAWWRAPRLSDAMRGNE